MGYFTQRGIIQGGILLLLYTFFAYTLPYPFVVRAETTEVPYTELARELSLKDSGSSSTLQNGKSATRRIKASLRSKLKKKTFRADEPIAVTFNNPENDTLNMHVLNANDEVVDIALSKSTSGGITTLEVVPSNEIKPGEYTLVVNGMDGKMLEQNFAWGVLAINTNKSYYKPGEKAHLEFAVLNEFGGMVCDAKLTLQISNDQLGVNDFLSSENGDITVNPECYSHNFTLKPDYEATYTTRQEGTYKLTLTAQTGNGLYTIVDTFNVSTSIPFDIERITATRIYPPNSYPVIFKITANQDFEGTIKETVPGSFFTSAFTTSTENVTRDTYVNAVTYAEPEIETETEETDLSEEEIIDEQPVSEQEIDVASPSADKEASASADGFQDSPLLSELQPLLGHTQISLEMPFRGSYPVTQHFGVEETDPLLLTQYLKYGVIGHDGIDFALPKGTPVLAADTGKVLYASNGDYGKTVILQHSWGRSYYGHLDTIQVPLRKVVKQGEQLGLSGNTGLSTGPHLHFGIKPTVYDDHNGYFGKVDPLLYINNDVTKAVAGISTKSESVNTDGLTQVTNINYPLKLNKGESIQVEYRYLAPQKSPESYLLGPLQLFDTEDKLVFEESRQWQIASDATWLTGWSYRKAIVLDAADVSDLDGANLSNFPVLISISSDTDLAANALDSGFDIAFTDSNHVKIPAERQSFNGTTGALLYWVSVPTLDYNDNTTIYVYYGNASSCDQAEPACDGTTNKNDVWTNANYVAVWHLEEVPTTSQVDSTGLGHSLSYQGGIGSGQSTTGKVGNGIDLDGSNDFMTTPDAADLDPTSAYTASAWLRVDSFGSGNLFWLKHNCASAGGACATEDFSYRHYYEGGSLPGRGRMSWDWMNSTPTKYFANGHDNSIGGSVLPLSTFAYIVNTKTTSAMTLYMNGADKTSTDPGPSGNTRNATDWVCLGADCAYTGEAHSKFHNGMMDEVRIASVSRTDGWIATEYTNQNSPTGFISSLGVQECETPPSLDKLLRHGQYFDACGRHAYTF